MILKPRYQKDNYEICNFTALEDEEKLFVLKMRNNDSIRAWMLDDSIIAENEHMKFINSLGKNNRDAYFVVKEINVVYGVIYLNKIDLTNRNAYLGIYSNPFDKIKGSGNICMDALLYLAFNILNLHSLKLEVFSSNSRAIDFYIRHGFSEEGNLKEFIYRGGVWIDMRIMGKISNT